eukprot:gene1327-2556_t
MNEIFEKAKGTNSKQVFISIGADGDVTTRGDHLVSLSVNIRQWISCTFLPVGFPVSVKKEYLEYQFYDSLQALCSYFRSVLCTKALLVGAGVGSAQASALSAAITWVLRDGIGMIGSVTFASIFSEQFGSYVKEWRLFADIINDVALTLDMLSPVFPQQLYLPIISCSSICKAMCGISAGATKLCITNHLCLANNAGDLAAKENTQETAVTLVGLILGLLIAQSMSDNDSVTLSWMLFIFFTIIHVLANYWAVSCLRLSSINRPRSWLLIRALIQHHRIVQSDLHNSNGNSRISKRPESVSTSTSEAVLPHMNIEAINAQESVFLSLLLTLFGPNLGCRLSHALNRLPCKKVDRAKCFESLQVLFENEGYMIIPQVISLTSWKEMNTVAIVLADECSKMVELKAYFHAIYLMQSIPIVSSVSSVSVSVSKGDVSSSQSTRHVPFLGVIKGVVSVTDVLESKAVVESLWTSFKEELRIQGWDVSETALQLGADKWRYEMNYDALYRHPPVWKLVLLREENSFKSKMASPELILRCLLGIFRN